MAIASARLALQASLVLNLLQSAVLALQVVSATARQALVYVVVLLARSQRLKRKELEVRRGGEVAQEEVMVWVECRRAHLGEAVPAFSTRAKVVTRMQAAMMMKAAVPRRRLWHHLQQEVEEEQEDLV